MIPAVRSLSRAGWILLIAAVFVSASLFASTLFRIVLPAYARRASVVGGDGPSPGMEMALHRLRPAAPAAQHGPADPVELERFSDQVFGQYMPQLHVPGAVFACVRDGKLLFEKGYGFANVGNRAPVLPNRTLFRVGSVSKLFVATAAMQLAEHGKLDLHADVNRYLAGFRIPDRYDRPITMAALLTHTAGFDDQIIGMAAPSEAEKPALDDYLRRRMPPRALPPGTVVSYSNHGSALAGLLVQQISGEPFSGYVERHIFEPLRMQHSSFELPARLAPDMATGYEYDRAAGVVRPVPHDAIVIGPAGALNSTADDMAHFMIAHLQDGRYGDQRILTEATAREMHRQQFTHHSRLPGFCYGFYERQQNGIRGIEHGGNWRGFATLLVLLPGEKTGFFIASNATQPLLPEIVARALVDHYYPARSSAGDDSLQAPAKPRGAKVSQGAGDLSRFAGAYRFTRYDRHTACKLFAAFSEMRLASRADHLVMTFPGIPVTRWMPAGPLLFRLAGSGTDPLYLAFKLDSGAKVAYACLGPTSFERLKWWDTDAFQIGLASCEALVFLSFAVAPRRLLVHGIRGEVAGKAGDDRLGHAAYLDVRRIVLRRITLGRRNGLLNLISLFTLPQAFLQLGFNVVYGVPLDVRLMLYFPVLSALVAAAAAVTLATTWKSGQWRPVARVLVPLEIAASVAFLWQINYWNLLGWRV